jgi:Haem-binding domain
MIKKILILLLAVLVVIQFFHPKRNKSTGDQPNYIGKAFTVPEDVHAILAKACLDCHSNNTRYPWYCNFQPFDWWIAGHIRNGKKDLNLDEFSNRSPRFQYNKLGEVVKLVKEDEMPLSSYTWIHKDAKLTMDEKTRLMNWAGAIRDLMKAKYPIDSLQRKK